MKKIILAIALIAGTVGVYSFTTKKAATFAVDTTASKVEFVGSKATGTHPGYFMLKSGTVMVDGGKLTGGSFVIDLSTLKISDGAGAKLEGHLKSPDFLDFSKGTDVTYTISTVKYTSATTADIDGNLTMKGITGPVKFTATTTGDAKTFSGDAKFTLDRTAFGVTYDPTKVSKDVAISVHLVAAK